jgi:hypothetical protein
MRISISGIGYEYGTATACDAGRDVDPVIETDDTTTALYLCVIADGGDGRDLVDLMGGER